MRDTQLASATSFRELRPRERAPMSRAAPPSPPARRRLAGDPSADHRARQGTSGINDSRIGATAVFREHCYHADQIAPSDSARCSCLRPNIEKDLVRYSDDIRSSAMRARGSARTMTSAAELPSERASRSWTRTGNPSSERNVTAEQDAGDRRSNAKRVDSSTELRQASRNKEC